MRIRDSIVLASLASLLLMPAPVRSVGAVEGSPVDDASPPTTTSWTCWTARSRILCELNFAAANDPLPPPTRQETVPQPHEPSPPVALSPGRHGGNLPAIARQLQQNPEQFAGRRLAIPTFGVPRSALDAEELASSVVCSGRADCRVDFLRSLSEIVLYEEERRDPALR